MERPQHRKASVISRRRFLRILGLTGVGALTSVVGRIPYVDIRRAHAASRRRVDRWSDPKTWGGRVPGRDDFVVISKRIVLNVNAHVRGVIVKPKGKLVFDPRRSVTLRSDENVVVRGQLTMRPRRPWLVHRLLFPAIDERRFVGGGTDVVRSDTGLWVPGNGALDILGSPKLAWTRAAGAIAAGATSVTLQDEPVGWRVGDEVALTPTLSPAKSNHDVAYDVTSVAAIDRPARRITLRLPTAVEHPAVEVRPGKVMTAEVLNLTRNVRIEGTAAGRTHVWMRSSRRQRLRNMLIRFVGPRRPGSANISTEPIPGRYGVHFHLMKDSSRRSLVEGVVVRDSGNHAFVAHESHGVTFRNCISHSTFEEAYWWDPSSKVEDSNSPPSDDVLYERCVASMVMSDASTDSFHQLAGFFLGARKGNVIRGCVAVGVQGGPDCCGFLWPEKSPGVWTVDDCVGHNNRAHGITAWGSNELPNVITRFTAYHNGRFGIFHGLYWNSFVYNDCILYANKEVGVLARAISLRSATQTFSGLYCDQAGFSPYCVMGSQLVLPPTPPPVLFTRCDFRGYSKAAFGFVNPPGIGQFPHSFSIVDSTFEGNEFWLGPDINPASRIRFLDSSRGSMSLRRSDQPGEFRPDWNASVSRIS